VSGIVSAQNEHQVLNSLVSVIVKQLNNYPTKLQVRCETLGCHCAVMGLTCSQYDESLLQSGSLSHRRALAVRLRAGEKRLLIHALAQIEKRWMAYLYEGVSGTQAS